MPRWTGCVDPSASAPVRRPRYEKAARSAATNVPLMAQAPRAVRRPRSAVAVAADDERCGPSGTRAGCIRRNHARRISSPGRAPRAPRAACRARAPCSSTCPEPSARKRVVDQWREPADAAGRRAAPGTCGQSGNEQIHCRSGCEIRDKNRRIVSLWHADIKRSRRPSPPCAFRRTRERDTSLPARVRPCQSPSVTSKLEAAVRGRPSLQRGGGGGGGAGGGAGHAIVCVGSPVTGAKRSLAPRRRRATRRG
jgi:hypothetical protein